MLLFLPLARHGTCEPTSCLLCGWRRRADWQGRGGGGVADRVEAAAVRGQVRAVRAVRGGAGAGGAAGRRRQGRGRARTRRRQGPGELHRPQAPQLEVPVRGPATPGSVIRLRPRLLQLLIPGP